MVIQLGRLDIKRFLVDLAVPDVIPVVDELLLGILTLIAARRKPSADRTPVRP